MKRILSFKPELEGYIESYLSDNQGVIYDPVKYILDLGGKRLRPCLLLAIVEALGADRKQALPLAGAIEVFHNFTLLHDDIMDEAETRRGESAVHIKWNRDQAILSGDIMFAMSHELLTRTEVKGIKEIHELFSRTAKEVCIGQQMDMDFEQRDDVTEGEYLEMIRLKTSVLIGAATAMGAIAADCSKECIAALYSFGENIGLSFQIQDDILDAFGESAAVGKRIGGDILNNKKTLLYLKAQRSADADSKAELDKWYSTEVDSQEKIDSVKRIMKNSGALAEVRSVQEEYIHAAIQNLRTSGIKGNWYSELESLAMHQLERSF